MLEVCVRFLRGLSGDAIHGAGAARLLSDAKRFCENCFGKVSFLVFLSRVDDHWF